MKNYLNFETDIKELENELEKLKDPYNQSGLSEVDTQKISKTQNELDEKLKSIYSKHSQTLLAKIPKITTVNSIVSIQINCFASQSPHGCSIQTI